LLDKPQLLTIILTRPLTVSIITPPGVAGAADVVVTTTAGSATAVGAYTYVALPGI